MKIIYGKNLTNSEYEKACRIANECDILFDTARLLLYRGIDTVEQAKAFLSAGKKGFNDPFDLNGMQEAVDRIYKAKENGERVLVFGDYDADGVCATSILFYCLKKMGVDAYIYVPEREEGYGLNITTINRLEADGKINLLITVDCGISDQEKIRSILQSGIDVIVTDHHEPPQNLPECVCINPKIKGQKYPFDGLCGAGVAYKLGRALIGERADDCLDLVALATVADSMDLVKENRDLVVEGLKLINSKDKQRLAFKYLLPENIRQVTAQTLAYVIAPRINAGGRMGDANTALKIFTTDDESKIFDLAVKLNEYNIARQVECDNIYKEAKAQIIDNHLDDNDVIFVSDENWQAGFIGIVAAKLVEDFSRPVIVFAGYDGNLKGSARSVDDINIHDAICSAKDLLVAYGGHSQAAGVTVEKHLLQAFADRVNAYVKNVADKPDTEKKIYAEWEIEGKFSLRFAKEIELLEPFGVGNRRPIFTTEAGIVQSMPLKAGSVHYSFKTSAIDVLDFNGENNVFTLSLPIKKQIVFEPNLSVYKNKESLKGYCKGVVPTWGDMQVLRPYCFANQLYRIKNGKSGIARYIKSFEIDKYIADGTVFILSDYSNIDKYPSLKGLPTTPFYTDHKRTPVVIVSPKQLPEGYSKAVYLEAVSHVFDQGVENYVVMDIEGDRILRLLTTDREVFKEYFIALQNLSGKAFNGSAQFATQHFSDNDCQAIFVIEVFMELGIFKVENGVLRFDEKVKNALTNSKLYSKIDSIKG